MDHEKPIPDDEREYNEIPEDTATVTDLSSKPPTATTKVSSKPSSKTGRAKSPPKPQVLSFEKLIQIWMYAKSDVSNHECCMSML